jgi:HAD superfamily hydrolase (TIGR01509 family)
MALKGVLLDMDGVIVDSESFICEAAIRMFAEHGLEVSPDDFKPFIGAGENRYIGGVAEKYGFTIDIDRDKARTYEIYGQIIKGRLEPLPGVHAFIERCKNKGLKLAVATSADEIKMKLNFDEIGIPLTTFDATVNGLDIKNKKPDPDIFLVAASRLLLNPENCLVVEDAVNGVLAAKNAGARCLALTTSFNKQDLAKADWIAKNLSKAPVQCLHW